MSRDLVERMAVDGIGRTDCLCGLRQGNRIERFAEQPFGCFGEVRCRAEGDLQVCIPPRQDGSEVADQIGGVHVDPDTGMGGFESRKPRRQPSDCQDADHLYRDLFLLPGAEQGGSSGFHRIQ